MPDLDSISATSPGSGSWPNPRPGGMTRPEVLRYLMKPVADLPIFMGNVDSGQYGAWAEGSLITTERVLAFHLGVEKPSWLSPVSRHDILLASGLHSSKSASNMPLRTGVLRGDGLDDGRLEGAAGRV